MAENKTKPTSVSPDSYLAAIPDEGRRKDCEALTKLMAKASRLQPRMWGPSIVGFGTHTYALAGGKTGEICAIGFSSRKGDISVYGLAGEAADSALLDKLGKYKRAKGCLYIRRLSDVDLDILAQLIDSATTRKLGGKS